MNSIEIYIYQKEQPCGHIRSLKSWTTKKIGFVGSRKWLSVWKKLKKKKQKQLIVLNEIWNYIIKKPNEVFLICFKCYKTCMYLAELALRTHIGGLVLRRKKERKIVKYCRKIKNKIKMDIFKNKIITEKQLKIFVLLKQKVKYCQKIKIKSKIDIFKNKIITEKSWKFLIYWSKNRKKILKKEI